MAIFTLQQQELQHVFDTLLHQGITKYKKKHSKASLPAQVEAEKQERGTRQGAIFVVRTKADFTATGVKGYVVTSKETLLNDAAALTHFTPNVYRTSGYTDEKRRYIHGFEERNLQQINTFVVDIDTKKYPVNELLVACMDESIGLPTFIVESARGFQLYFVLSSPLFISNKENFRGLKVAKRISDNLKRSLQSVEADLFCNDFGFFRLPKADNVVYQDLTNTYSMAAFINWSMRQDDDVARPLFVVPTKKTNTSIMQTEWFDALVHTANIKGEKGMLGRNNTLFTLALICYAEGWDLERAENFLDEFNTRLQHPLKGQDIYAILQSAYSGKYNGPSKEYVEALLALHVPNGDKYNVSFGNKAWYKFKKERADRTRSHYDEWEQDIIDYITAEKSSSEPFIWRTQKELCEAIGLSQSTLNVVIKQSQKLLKTVTGKGRSAKTGWTTVALFTQYAMDLVQTSKATYRKQLIQIIQESIEELETTAAYHNLINYLNELLFKESPPTMHENSIRGSG
ncbi:MAG: primase C-terminal domain-containing protein [Solibacillus sp.]